MSLSRRELFRIVGVAGAAAGLEGCERIAPQAKLRDVPGPERTAVTVCGGCPAGCGISVRVVGENAVNIAGVPEHPVNEGGLCPRGVAQIQDLYHPDRLRAPQVRAGRASARANATWDQTLLAAAAKLRGASPVLAVGWLPPLERHLVEWFAASLGARLVEVRAPGAGLPVGGLRALLGGGEWRFDVGRAGMVLSLGADWLQSSDSPVEAQRAFATLRRGAVRARIVTAAARLSVTAARSDAWIPVRDDQLELFGLSLLHALLARGGAELERRAGPLAALAREERFVPETAAAALGIAVEKIEAVAASLLESPRPVVLAPPGRLALETVAVSLNVILGAVDREGGLVRSRAPKPALPPQLAARSTGAFPEGEPAPVILYRANPLYLAPNAGWAQGLAQAPFALALAPYLDESAAMADAVLPLSAALEGPQLTWGATFEGAPFSAAGPAVVRPLYDTRSGPEALFALAGALGLDLPWKDAGTHAAAVAEAVGAAEILAEGGSVRPPPAALPPAPAPANALDRAAEILRAAVDAPQTHTERHPLWLHVHVPLAFMGGEGAHLPHLHGLSGPEGREVWNTFAEIHPETARRAGVVDRQPAWVESPLGRIRAVARVRAGIRPDCVAVAIGLGHTELGRWAAGFGQNPAQLLDREGLARVRVWRAT